MSPTFILFVSVYCIFWGLNNTFSTSTWKTDKNKSDASYYSLNILYSKAADRKKLHNLYYFIRKKKIKGYFS